MSSVSSGRVFPHSLSPLQERMKWNGVKKKKTNNNDKKKKRQPLRHHYQIHLPPLAFDANKRQYDINRKIANSVKKQHDKRKEVAARIRKIKDDLQKAQQRMVVPEELLAFLGETGSLSSKGTRVQGFHHPTSVVEDQYELPSLMTSINEQQQDEEHPRDYLYNVAEYDDEVLNELVFNEEDEIGYQTAAAGSDEDEEAYEVALEDEEGDEGFIAEDEEGDEGFIAADADAHHHSRLVVHHI